MFYIRIYKKVYPPYYTIDNQRVLLIELGKWWAISISRLFAETLWSEAARKEGNVLFRQREFIKLIKEAEIIPFWYGFAYYDFNCDMAAYMPIPFNLVRAGWEWFKHHVLMTI